MARGIGEVIMEKKLGELYVVATPIGHLEDFSHRAKNILAMVDVIVAEDPRYSKKIIEQTSEDVKWVRIADALEKSVAVKLIDLLKVGKNVALISDAGTPLISDPGYRLVRACRESNIKVVPIPGPCAAIAALSVSGISCHSFKFLGFMPSSSSARNHQLKIIKESPVTTILYESPHRIHKLGSDFKNKLSLSREVFFIREMTKKFEESYFGNVEGFDSFLKSKENLKGEMVVIIGPSVVSANFTLLEKMAKPLADLVGVNKASALLAQGLGLRKKEVYNFIKEGEINL